MPREVSARPDQTRRHVLFWPTVAHADSDGYYWGYLAYETRSDPHPPGHVLHVLRLSQGGGNCWPNREGAGSVETGNEA